MDLENRMRTVKADRIKQLAREKHFEKIEHSLKDLNIIVSNIKDVKVYESLINMTDKFRDELFIKRQMKEYISKCVASDISIIDCQSKLANRILSDVGLKVTKGSMQYIFAIASILLDITDLFKSIDLDSYKDPDKLITEVEKSVVIAKAFSYIKNITPKVQWDGIEGETDLDKICVLIQDVDNNIEI